MLLWVLGAVASHTTATTTTIMIIMITTYRSLGHFYLMILLFLVSSYPPPSPHLSVMRPSTVHARHRISPYPQISLEDALKVILNEIKPLGVVSLPVSGG